MSCRVVKDNSKKWQQQQRRGGGARNSKFCGGVRRRIEPAYQQISPPVLTASAALLRNAVCVPGPVSKRKHACTVRMHSVHLSNNVLFNKSHRIIPAHARKNVRCVQAEACTMIPRGYRTRGHRYGCRCCCCFCLLGGHTVPPHSSPGRQQGKPWRRTRDPSGSSRNASRTEAAAVSPPPLQPGETTESPWPHPRARCYPRPMGDPPAVPRRTTGRGG